MILDCEKYMRPCDCGREHPLETGFVVCESGAMKNFEKYAEMAGFKGRRAVIYDTTTYNLPTVIRPKADKNIVLEAKGLHSEKNMIESISEELGTPDYIVTVGSGTLMDFARYHAYKLGIPFIAVPTLASSDGFTANICSIVIDGQKKSIPMAAPRLVIADLDIISGAPMWLNISGVQDILSKHISLADWKIANLVSGEYFCERVYNMSREALDMMNGAAEKLRRGEAPDFEAMTMAQMISGLTMQMLNHSRAASGAEHLIAHLVEMKPPRFENAAGIHGECVGVGTLLCAKKYHELAEKTPKALPFEPLEREWVEEKFGALAEKIFKENENDVLSTFSPQNIAGSWDKIREIIAEIPSYEELYKLFEDIGAKKSLADIGIDEALRDEILPISAAIRNRLTLARMLRVLEF